MGLVKPVWPVLQRGHPLTNGLVLGVPFSEGAGNKVFDFSGHGGIGTFQGTPSWIGGPFGSALSLASASSQSISFSNTGAINPQETLPSSFVAWVKTSDTGTQVISATWQYQITSGYRFAVGSISAGTLDLLYCVASPSGSNYRLATSAGTVNDGNWHFVVATYDGSNFTAGVKFYIDGVQSATVPNSDIAVGTLDNAVFNIGRIGGPAPQFFNGGLDGVAIYNRVLSATEAAQLYFDPFAIYRKPSRWWEAVIAGGGTTVIRDSPLYLELLATQTRDATTNLELLSTQQSNRPLNVELLGTQFIASGLPAELLSTQKSDAPIYLESLSGISTDRPVFAESLATQISAASLNLESLSTVISSSLAYLEDLLTARADYTVQVESLGLISISIDGTISIELLSSQQTNNPVNSELLTTQVSNIPIDLEALSNVRTDNLAAAESLAGVRADNPIQVENLGLVSVSVDGTIVLESLTTVRRSDIVQLENISAVFALLTDGAIQLELLVGTAIPLDLTHSFTRLAPAEQFIRDLRKLLYTALVPYTEGRMPEVGALPNVQPNQKQTVGIDFGNFLPPGVALSGTPTVTLSTAFGTDPAAASRIVSGPFVGTANKNIGGTGLAGTAIIFQVGGCLPGVTYVVDAYCTRTDGDIAEASTRFSCNAPN